jgi:hypothetical protein
VRGRPPARTSSSASTIRRISRTNHGSNFEASATSSSETPARIACAATSTRSGRGVASAAWKACAPPSPGGGTSSRPESPVSRLRSPFCSASAKERPIAIASPTDFMLVVSVGCVPGNFSKVKRGILTTT